MEPKKSSVLLRLLATLGCFALVLSLLGAAPALAQQKAEFTLNWAAFIPGSHPEILAFNKGFIAKAVELSKGRLAFKFRGGPETISLVDLPKATQSRDCRFLDQPGRGRGDRLPGCGATILSRISVAEERKNGTYAFMDELCNKGGLHYMGRNSAGR